MHGTKGQLHCVLCLSIARRNADCTCCWRMRIHNMRWKSVCLRRPCFGANKPAIKPCTALRKVAVALVHCTMHGNMHWMLLAKV